MIPAQVFNRIFQIHFNKRLASCFLMEFEDKQYIITAKHVVHDIGTEDIIEFKKKDKLIPYKANLVGHSNFSDISVLSINYYIETFPLEFSSQGIIWGQDLYFLGFPFGLNFDVGEKNRGFDMPFVKKSIVSAISIKEPDGILFLDGINNPGFSGGPVAFQDLISKKFKIAGVISGYRTDSRPALINNEENDFIMFKENTGIITAYSIENAIQIIKDNPIGMPVIKRT